MQSKLFALGALLTASLLVGCAEGGSVSATSSPNDRGPATTTTTGTDTVVVPSDPAPTGGTDTTTTTTGTDTVVVPGDAPASTGTPGTMETSAPMTPAPGTTP